jgi:hypothetical protein
MGQYNGAVITTAGQAVLAQAIGGAELTITKVVTSATAIPPGTDLTALTTIADVEQTEQPTSVQVFNDNIVQISTRFSNAGVAEAYLIQTLGVFGQVTGGAETLLAVSTAITPDQMPAEDAIAPSAFIYNIQLTVQSADQITVTVNDAGTATVEDIRIINITLQDHQDQISKNAADISDLQTSNSQAWDAINHIYEGRDLTVVFADEIANYTDEWQWIQARLNNHDVSGFRVGDYIPITIEASGSVPAETHRAEIAGINTYYDTEDTAVGYHIDWITKDCYSQTVHWNTSNNNNGSADNSNPFLVSNLKSWLDNTLYPLLPSKLKSVIKVKRILAPYRYTSGSTLTDDNSWGWQNFYPLWAPLEGEIFDQTVWSTRGYGHGQAIQYPIFANSYAHRIKGDGPNGSRCTWWTASARSGDSTSVVAVYRNGNANDMYTSYPCRVPVCFRTMEDQI